MRSTTRTQHAGATALETCGCSPRSWKNLLADCSHSSCTLESRLRLPAFSGTTRLRICAIMIGSGYLFGDVSSLVIRSGHRNAYDPKYQSQKASCLHTHHQHGPYKPVRKLYYPKLQPFLPPTFNLNHLPCRHQEFHALFYLRSTKMKKGQNPQSISSYEDLPEWKERCDKAISPNSAASVSLHCRNRCR